jgi:hypothetical protein
MSAGGTDFRGRCDNRARAPTLCRCARYDSVMQYDVRFPCLLVGLAGALAILIAPAAAAAQEADQPALPESFEFAGRGVYAAGGIGVLPGLGEAASSFRIQGVFPVQTVVAMEVTSFGYRFSTDDHHGDEVSAHALGIGTGVRINAPPDWIARPYVAGRFQHLHFFPDPWGGHDPADGGGSEEHSSHHRWGAAIAGGVDAGLFGPSSRWRAGLEGELGTLTGPGIDAVVQVVAVLGVGF